MQTGKARANLGSHKNREERHWQDHAHDDQGKVCGHGHTPDDGKSCACADAAPAPDNGAEKYWPPNLFCQKRAAAGFHVAPSLPRYRAELPVYGQSQAGRAAGHEHGDWVRPQQEIPGQCGQNIEDAWVKKGIFAHLFQKGSVGENRSSPSGGLQNE